MLSQCFVRTLEAHKALIAAGALLSSVPALAATQPSTDLQAASAVTIHSTRHVQGEHVPADVVQLSRGVGYSDLDLSTPDGENVLHDRIQKTALEVCQQLDQLYPPAASEPRIGDAQCIADAVNSAMPQADSAVTAARQAVYAAEIRVNQADIALGALKSDRGFSKALNGAQGIVIVPHSMQTVNAGIGGDAVLLIHRHGAWTNPAFYQIGEGYEAEHDPTRMLLQHAENPMALLLMNRGAVVTFQDQASHGSSKESMSPLRAVSGSAAATQDNVMVWTSSGHTSTVQVNDFRVDEAANRAYYGQSQVSSRQIFDAQVANPHTSNANLLRSVLPLRMAFR